MAWFRRSKKADPAPVEETTAAGTPAETGAPETAEATSATEVHEDSRPRPQDAAGVTPAGYLRLGSLWLPEIEGMMLTFETDQTQSQVTAVQVLRGDSALQLQAFAAPKSSGLWDDIRTEIAEGLAGRAQVREESGPYGAELVADMGGGNVMRFVGVDGPRWFLRGVLSGQAATDEAVAEPLRQVFAAVVVDRGGDAMGPRELLPLTLPGDAGGASRPEPGRSADDLNPFERGPEIAEIR